MNYPRDATNLGEKLVGGASTCRARDATRKDRASGAESDALRCRQRPSDAFRQKRNSRIPRDCEGYGWLDRPEVPPRGKELPQVFPKKTASDSRGDVRSDVSAREDTGSPSPAAPNALADLVARLSALPPETLTALKTLFGGEPPPA